MHTQFKPMPRNDPTAPALLMQDRDDTARNPNTAFFVALLGFLCFMPYPSITVGNRSALQFGNILSLLMCAPVLLIPWRKKSYHLSLLLLAPVCISVVKVALTGDGDLALSLKSVPARAITWFSLLATQYYAPLYALEMLTGIAVATVLHVAVGLWQMYSFTNGDFPFPELYVNASFLSVQDMAKTIANYIQRPFGIFPEPSAMSSSLAPWIVFWIAELCGLVRLKRGPAPWQRTLFAIAAAGALMLIIISRSGHTFVTLFAVVILAAIWLMKCRANLRNYLVILGVCCIVLPVILWFGAEAMTDRLGGKSDVGNSSWEDRSSSLRVGYMMLVNDGPATLLFGIGPALTAPAMYGALRLDAVWSVILNYIYETGMIGLIAVLWVGAYVAKVWKSTNYNVVFTAITGVWFIGILLTTSYEQLLPIWVALGWLTVWPEICLPTLTNAAISHSSAAHEADNASADEPELHRPDPADPQSPVLPWKTPGESRPSSAKRSWSEP